MTDKRYPGSSILSLTALILSAVTLLFASCGVLEAGFESHTHPLAASASAGSVDDAPVIAPRTPTPVGIDHVPPTPEPAFTPVPVEVYPAPAGLRVVFVKDEDVWLWTVGESDIVPLTTAGEIYGDIRISDDGTTVAFARAEELWAIDSDGTGERRLVSAADLSRIATETKPDDPGARINRFAWVPGTHVVAFNTRVRVSDRSVLNHDLHLVDADTLAQTVLLAPGEGGEFTYSPDGSQVAIVTPGDVSLIDAYGGNRRDSLLTYAPVGMVLASDYYVQPAWAADGSSLLVAVPPADPQTRPIQHTTVWRIPTSGDPAELVTTIDALPVEGAVSFSHDLNYVAYGEVQQAEEGAAERVEVRLKVVRLENGDWFAYPDVSTAYGWAPDSRRFAFVAGRQVSQLQIGQWSAPTLPSPIDAGVPVDDVHWVDTYRYIFVARRNWEMGAEGDSFDLILGDTNGTSTILTSMADHPVYDFAQADPIRSVPAISPPRPTSTPWTPLATPAPTVTPWIEGMATPYCRPSDGSVSLDASATTLAVGQAVSITVTLTNGDTSDARMGQVRYLLGVQPSHVLTADDLGPVARTRSLDPGESGTVVFVLRAAAPGRVTLTGSTDFEMHALDTSWGSWSGCDSWPLEIVVTPSPDTNQVVHVIGERYTRDDHAYPATTIAATAEGTWIGFGQAGGGVWRYLDGALQVFDQAGGFPISDTVQVLRAAPDGSVWAGAGCQLARYTGGDWEKIAGCDRLKGQVTDIAFTPDGATWVASALELSRFDGQAWSSYGKLAHYLAAGPDGALWVSGWEGSLASFYVARFDGVNWTAYPTLDLLGHGVGKIAVAPDGDLWGTAGEWGMVRFDGETWEHHTVTEGLPGNEVTELAVGPDGTLWTRGNKGLAYFNGDRWLPVVHEGATDQGPLAVGPNGTIWLGTPIGR